MNATLKNVLPFLRWFPMTGATLRADLLAGLTVALVLVPQSMAYAMLAGLPVVYGLYAALLPVVVGALFGNFSLLHTGPVAMLSLMSAAAIAPFAMAGSEEFIALSVMLALMVGVLRLTMGAFRLGGIVNLVSHPVLIGFTNAAALIIGLSQLRFILELPNPGTGSFLGDLVALLARVDQTYLPALAFALGAGLAMWGLARWLPKVPAALVAVVLATAVSAAVGYERLDKPELASIADPQARALIERLIADQGEAKRLNAALKAQRETLRAQTESGAPETTLAALRAEIKVAEVRIDHLKNRSNTLRMEINAVPLLAARTVDGSVYYRRGEAPVGAEISDRVWRFKSVKDGEVTLSAGGEVVGAIPQGLPALQMPMIDAGIMLALLPAAFVIALIGFMEATAVSKALAAKSHERIDANKELIGQGLANIAGAFFQSYAVSGSFSRSAVAARSGARTGLYAVVSAGVVVLVLLYLTPYLYHLPQAVLATIVMFAVFGLIRVTPLIQAWTVRPGDAVAGVLTFAATLAFAPDIANGVLVGMALAAAMFLMRTMKPRATVVGRKADGTMGGVDLGDLEPLGKNFVAVRFDRSLNYLNVAAFEDTLLEVLARYPEARGILVIGSGINEIDASGADKLRELAQRLRQQDVTLMLSSLKGQVMTLIERAGLRAALGAENVFASKERAIEAARLRFDPARA